MSATQPARFAAVAFFAAVLLGFSVGLARAEIQKFDVGPTGQAVYEGFTPVGPETLYSAQAGYGWTEAPKHFEKFRMEAFPDALSGDLAAPSEPQRGVCGYVGSFEFRVDVPPGEYEVHVLSGNYSYLP